MPDKDKFTKNMYYPDKVEILFKLSLGELNALLNLESLANECQIVGTTRPTAKAEKWGWHSLIYFTVPTDKFFRLLNTYSLGTYKIRYFEIARDAPKASEKDANLENNKIIRSLRKRRTTKHEVRGSRDSGLLSKAALDDGKFSIRTGYWGSKYLEFICYARYSKISGEPCLHTEWSIDGAYEIKKRTGIQTIEDLCVFDLEKWFEENLAKYMAVETIDSEKFGKWLWDCGRRRIFSRREQMRVVLAANTFLRVNEILSPAELAKWFRSEKIEIKSRRGRPSAWDKKILKVQSNSRFSTTL